MLRVISGRVLQDHIWCQGLNLQLKHASQVPFRLYYIFSPKNIFFHLYASWCFLYLQLSFHSPLHPPLFCIFTDIISRSSETLTVPSYIYVPLLPDLLKYFISIWLHNYYSVFIILICTVTALQHFQDASNLPPLSLCHLCSEFYYPHSNSFIIIVPLSSTPNFLSPLFRISSSLYSIGL